MRGGSSEFNLESQTSRPYRDVEENDGETSQKRATTPLERQEIEDETDKDRADDGTKTGQKGGEGTCSAIEEVGGESTLIGVEILSGRDISLDQRHWNGSRG